MRRQALHHLLGVGVGVATGEADELRAAVAIRQDDLARDVMRALDQVGRHQIVADAHAAILSPITFHVEDSFATPAGCWRVKVGK